MFYELAECTMLMLKVIQEMYNTQKISYKEFIDYTEMKLQFLSENIENISSETDKRVAFDIIYKCNMIMSDGDKAYLEAE